MSDAANVNKGNVCNENHKKSGPGRPAGYHGTGDKADLDNHANQMNDPETKKLKPNENDKKEDKPKS